MTTLNDIVNNMLEELNDDKEEIFENMYPEDVVHEYVDSHIPLWSAALFSILHDEGTALALDDSGLWDYDSEKGAFENVERLIQACIYERLSNEAHAWLYNQAEYNQ